MDVIFELPLDVGADAQRRPSTHSIYNLLKHAILSGHLPAGTKLPPTRLAGRHFGLSRNSMVPIYDRLAAEGLVIARRGSGTFVAPKVQTAVSPDGQIESSPRVADIRPMWLNGDIGERLRFWDYPAPDGNPSDVIDLRTCLVDQSLFPYHQFRRCMVKTLRLIERSPPPIQSPLGNQGSFQLRHAIADHVALMRALVCKPEDVIVTTGAQNAFELIANVFVEPGKTVVAGGALLPSDSRGLHVGRSDHSVRTARSSRIDRGQDSG
jgi:GntR family transcriptional regulator/MocR family aminotransferase